MSDESTIIGGRDVTPEQKRDSKQYVRNLLGDPDRFDMPLSNLPFETRISLAMVRVADDVADMKENGCSKREGDLARIRRLESWPFALKIGASMVGIVGLVIGFIWAMIQFFHTRPTVN
jgi:hypothetical protein